MFLVRKYLYDHIVEQMLNLHKVETSVFISYGSSLKDKLWEKSKWSAAKDEYKNVCFEGLLQENFRDLPEGFGSILCKLLKGCESYCIQKMFCIPLIIYIVHSIHMKNLNAKPVKARHKILQ